MEACHRRTIEEKFLFQRAADGLDDVSLDLIRDAVGVDDLPAIVHEEKTLHADFPVPAIDLDLGHRTDISGRRPIFGIAEAPSSHDMVPGESPRRGCYSTRARVARRMRSSTPRGSLRWLRRKSSGSAPTKAASSSTKHSLAKVFCRRPGDQIEDQRNGALARKCATVLMFGNV